MGSIITALWNAIKTGLSWFWSLLRNMFVSIFEMFEVFLGERLVWLMGLLEPVHEYLDSIDWSEWASYFELISYFIPIASIMAVAAAGYFIILWIRVFRWALSFVPFLNAG